MRQLKTWYRTLDQLLEHKDTILLFAGCKPLGRPRSRSRNKPGMAQNSPKRVAGSPP
jgi:hypothetical protein